MRAAAVRMARWGRRPARFARKATARASPRARGASTTFTVSSLNRSEGQADAVRHWRSVSAPIFPLAPLRFSTVRHWRSVSAHLPACTLPRGFRPSASVSPFCVRLSLPRPFQPSASVSAFRVRFSPPRPFQPSASVSSSLGGHHVGLHELADGKWRVQFCSTELGHIDRIAQVFVPTHLESSPAETSQPRKPTRRSK